MDETTPAVSTTKTAFKKVGRFLVGCFKVLLVVGVFLAGMSVETLDGLKYRTSEQVCFVENAITTACLRQENGTHYQWKVVAVRGEGTLSEEVIVIQYITPKYKVEPIGN